MAVKPKRSISLVDLQNQFTKSAQESRAEDVTEKTDETLLIVPFGDVAAHAFGSVDTNGVATVAKVVVHRHSNVRAFVHPKAVSMNDIAVSRDATTLTQHAVQGGGVLSVGAAIVLGGEDSGKSPLIKALSAGDHGRLIRFGEPLPGYLTDPVDAASELMTHLLDPSVKVIGIDSVKDLLATMSGGLMRVGIPRPFWQFVSNLSAISASLGKVVAMPLNVSTQNKEVMDDVTSAVNSNITNGLIHAATLNEGYSYSVLSRTGEGKKRSEGVVTLTFPNGEPELSWNSSNKADTKDGESDAGRISNTTLKVTKDITKTALIKAFQRGLKDE